MGHIKGVRCILTEAPYLIGKNRRFSLMIYGKIFLRKTFFERIQVNRFYAGSNNTVKLWIAGSDNCCPVIISGDWKPDIDGSPQIFC